MVNGHSIFFKTLTYVLFYHLFFVCFVFSLNYRMCQTNSKVEYFGNVYLKYCYFVLYGFNVEMLCCLFYCYTVET